MADKKQNYSQRSDDNKNKSGMKGGKSSFSKDQSSGSTTGQTDTSGMGEMENSNIRGTTDLDQ
ncbi:MAG: hypothetical protein A3C27_02345 [Candidatus Levybacteria bacterium RIFCSPHIGHO2_02_FULL_39_36]|uniref:Uncharacterized protein n=1 Tax=Candidatus Gottesmanbacteria bacterium RIFCSPHIGHO2_01_FULL_39_10 TaxID=1798375 RepID=A0A1F5ZS30_9BACT|nr:MAG: hypothetical protein A2773_03635 [Candidatus Gottesmanbacteria bacterium RIFCSPHIGHO2_01_FULL_39_10]OGH27784.1 MAG: hypothetical protein A3C27_02345 [Candidatus Levybacteria bacterium RIFCSPHIGHO2_02_FULL_39_36]